MPIHYSQPKGFVGRNICYAIMHDNKCYGSIVAGSTPRHLPGRSDGLNLKQVINNLFYHIEKLDGLYPTRNFTVKVLAAYRAQAEADWLAKYGDAPIMHESLVQLPRSGELYLRDGWTLVGTTIGYSCKRVAGKGTDSWSGKRVWNTTELKPKLVFQRNIIDTTKGN